MNKLHITRQKYYVYSCFPSQFTLNFIQYYVFTYGMPTKKKIINLGKIKCQHKLRIDFIKTLAISGDKCLYLPLFHFIFQAIVYIVPYFIFVIHVFHLYIYIEKKPHEKIKRKRIPRTVFHLYIQICWFKLILMHIYICWACTLVAETWACWCHWAPSCVPKRTRNSCFKPCLEVCAHITAIVLEENYYACWIKIPKLGLMNFVSMTNYYNIQHLENLFYTTRKKNK